MSSEHEASRRPATTRYQPDELFRSTAPYYARWRDGYPPELFEQLTEQFGLDGTQRVLDLGCGTGQLAVPLAPLVREVAAVDPEPGMLAEGRRLAADRDVANVHWQLGDSTRLAGLDLGVLDLVVMGASFHWMDRDATLAQLDGMVTPTGGVVVASGGHSAQPPPWAATIARVRERWLGPQRRAGSGTYQHPPEGHEVVLRRSAFSAVQVCSWERTVTRDVDAVVGLQLSFSFSAPALFGDRLDEFTDELRRALLDERPDEVFSEQVVTEALIATRP